MSRAACVSTRRDLVADDRKKVYGDAVRHLDDCPSCAEFAQRLEAAHAGLRAHRLDATPDAGFAARVIAELPGERRDEVGRLALRFLPAAVAIALALGVWSWRATSWPGDLAVSDPVPTEDVLSWVLQEDGS